MPSIFAFLSLGSIFAQAMPATKNISEISIFRPMKISNDDFVGVPQTGANWVKWNTSPFQISLNTSMPQNARPANSTFQFFFSTSTE